LDGQDISTAINSEAVVVDLSRSDFRYANTVLNVSSAADVVDYQSIEILGLPNAFGINARPENGWAPAREDTAPSIELTFENASPINTLWFHGEAAFSINSVEAWNPGTNEYEVIASGIASEIPLGEELEVNFPTTSFPVDRIRIIGFTNFYEFLQDGTINIRSLDAVAIGENGLQITNPTNLVGSIVNSTIINVSWNHPNVTDETVYRLERSTDNMSFTEISNAGGIVGFTRFRDATVPDVDQVYYRVRAELSGQISEFSEVLVVERCGQDLVIPEGSYTASAIESSPIGGNSENVNASIVSNNDGTYTISNVFASYLSGLGGSTTATGTLSEGCGGILNIEVPDLAVGCGDNSVVVTSVTYTSASETLEYIFDFTSCGISVTVTFVKDATEPVQPAPGNLNVNVANANSTFLRWTDNSNFESSWVIERSTDGVNYNEIADVLPNPQRERSTDTELETYIDNTVTPGTQYFYQVRARNGSGDSDPSNSAVVTVAAPPFTQILVGDVVEDAPSQSYSGTWADLDGDADLDLYVTNWFQGADPALVTMENYLYLNQGNGSFVKSTSSPLVDGEYVSRGAFVGDFDNDGNLDLFVNGQGSSAFVDDANSILFFGDGAGGYVSQTDFQAEAYNAAVADLNNDGLLDIIAPTASEVYINLGNRQFDTQPFTDYVPNFLGASWANLTPDLNSDGLPDLILNGDSRVDIFLNNNGVPLTNTYGNDQLGLARGAVFGDFDNDLDLDVIISSRAFGQTGVVTSSIFLQNDGNGAFVEVQADQFLDQVPITQRGLTVLDYNNDGNEDLFWLVDDGQPIIYEGAGDGTFTTLTESLENLPTINAFSHPSVGDFNDDGRQDLFISNFDATGAVGLFVNSQGGNNFLKIDLEGSNSNRFGIGSQIEVKSGGQWRMKQVTSTNGVWSSNEITAHFGLGAASQADSVVVRWTSGKTTVLKDIGANQRILVPETVQPPVVTINPLVTNQPSPELAGTVDIPEATIEVELPQGIYPATNNQDGTWTLPAGSIVPGLKTTTYDVIVRGLLQDTVGIDDTIDELRVDVTLPVVDIDFLGTSVSSPELTGFIDDSTATLSLEIDGSTYENELVRDGNSWSLPAGVISPGLTDGTYDVIASSIDSLGNVGSDATQNELVITTEIIALSPSRITPFSFRANWSEGTDAQSYRLDVAEDENFSSFVEGFEDLTVAETNTTVAGLDFDTDYFYRVRFENTANEISGNSETISLRTTISPETVADFNELAEIYNQTGGENWTNSGGWTTEPRLQNWDFISLENGRVTSIDLSNNNVTGFFPLKDSLTEVSSINLAENEIEGYGDLSKLSSLITLAVDNNQLLFDDIELLFGKIPTFTYQNQAGIKFVQDEDRQIEVNQGNDTTLTISTPGSANVYTYFREDLNDPDGVPVQVQNGQEYGVNDNVLDILSIDFGNMGIMSGQVTSTIVDDLVIPVDTVGVYATAEVGITVIDPNGTTILADQVNGALLFTSRQGTAGFDTLEFVENRASQFSFDKVILGNYLIAVDSDPDKYVPSYYSNTFLWEEADTIRFRKDSTFEITIVGDPEPLTADDGEGTLRVLVEEDFGEETDAGRIDARRRAARRKCGLRKRRTGGRIDQDEGIFDLIAYGETDDQGQFEFGFLPQGQYRFFVEYPGIPLDESSFVEFEVGEAGISDTDFKLEAFATADGVQVEIQAVLGVILEYFKNLQIYPNPSSEFLKIKYRHLRSGTIRAQMTDLAGLELWSRTVPQGYDGSLQIDVSSLAEGMYILRFFDEKAASSNVVTYRVLVGR
ncbi:MAG: FG-GAP-like repeat-containing protein, partial [Bacteroidota bacterium]